MRISSDPSVHLTYCLNVHPGESWAENLEAIKSKVLAVRDDVGDGKPFGLGLRLSNEASLSLAESETCKEFKRFLEENSLYVFTVNAFPYGAFHGTRVKEQVYRPDWREADRRDYTMRVADILADLLPESVSGSISTVPCSYKSWIRTDEDRSAMVAYLMETVLHLDRIQTKTGRHIHLGLEPEPDCYLETTTDVISFFDRFLYGEGCGYIREKVGCGSDEATKMIRRHLGICFDACHLSLQYEDLSRSLNELCRNNVRISKIHISGAIKTTYMDNVRQQLAEFDDDVYLHQVKARTLAGDIISYPDLSAALAATPREAGQGDEWRVHCHIPLYFEQSGDIRSTAEDLTREFFQTIAANGIEHLEIETYTFNVLPPTVREKGLVRSIAAEYRWVLSRCSSA